MTDRFERDARWVRFSVWTGALVLLAVTGAVTVNIVQRNRTADHRQTSVVAAPKALPPAPTPSRPVDYDAYERANAERNSKLIANEAAAYDAYRSAQKGKEQPPLRRLPEPKTP